jgi:hypothetical protein
MPKRSFPIALRFRDQDLAFLACDIPTGWFFHGFPDDMPLTDCWKAQSAAERLRLVRQQEEWHAAILTRGVYVRLDDRWVSMTRELVQRLGGTDDGAPGEHLVRSYFSGVGWILPGQDGFVESDAPTLPASVVQIDPLAEIERRRALTRIPGKNVLWAVKEVASRAGASAHRVWRSWDISDFVWTWRVSLEAELKRENEKKAGASALPPEMAMIGVS